MKAGLPVQQLVDDNLLPLQADCRRIADLRSNTKLLRAR